MTGSEPANTTVPGDDEKAREEDAREQLKREDCRSNRTESSSTTGSTQKLPLSDSFNNSLSSSDSLSCSNSPESSPSPDLHSSCEQRDHPASIGSKVVVVVEEAEETPPVRTMTSTGSKSAAHKMKRTVSNCNVRNTSTMCSKESSYVYHCPSSRRTQKRSQPTKVPDPTPTMDSVETQFHLMLLEDSISDETQSMVELGTQLFRSRGHHGSSLRRGRESRNGQVPARLVGGGTKVAGVDHFHSGHQARPTNQRLPHQGHPHVQYSTHLALERVHSVCGRQTAQIPGVKQEQLLATRPRPSRADPASSHQPHLFSHYQLRPVHQHMISHRSNIGTRPHPLHNTQQVPGRLTRVTSAQVPRTMTPAVLGSENKVKLHIPSGRKMESLV